MIKWIEKIFNLNFEELVSLSGHEFIDTLAKSAPKEWDSIDLPDDFSFAPKDRETIHRFFNAIVGIANLKFIDRFFSRLFEVGFANSGDEQKARVAYGRSLAMQHRYNESINQFEISFELSNKPDALETSDQIMNYLGVVYYRMGELQKALEAHEKSLQILAVSENEERKAIYYNNLGIVQKEIGLIREAAESFKKALPIMRKLDRPEFLAVLYGNIGTVYNQLDRHKEALSFQEEALQLHRKTGNELEECRTLGNKGNILREMKDYAEAAKTIREALTLAEQNDYKLLQVINLYNLGLLYKSAGDNEEAIKSFEHSVGIAEKIDDKEGIWRAYLELGDLKRVKGDLESGFTYLKRAEGVFESMRRDLKADRDRVAFLANQKELIEKIVFLELERNAENFWGVMQDGKSRSLREMLIGDGQKETDSNIEWSEEHAANLWDKDLLGVGDAIVDFFMGEDALIRLVYNPLIGLRKTVKRIPRREIADEVDRVYEEIKLLESMGVASKDALIMESEGEWLKPYQNLFFLLFDDIANELLPFDQLIINPHGILHRLPFSALMNEETPLVRNHSIVLSPSLQLMAYHLANPVQFDDGMKLFVTSPDDNASMTLDEGRELSEIVGNGILVELGDEINVRVPSGFRGDIESIVSLGETSEFKNNLSHLFEYLSLFHFAGHGVFDASEPMHSYLKLPAGQTITSEEFYRGDFQSERMKLIVLSACETGKMRIGKGDELWGFARALFGSGARSLLLSLWKLEDKSSYDLMLEFYDNLFQEDLPLGCSLGAAQRHILDRMGNAHPFFWAPFCLIGSPY